MGLRCVAVFVHVASSVIRLHVRANAKRVELKGKIACSSYGKQVTKRGFIPISEAEFAPKNKPTTLNATRTAVIAIIVNK